MEYYYTRAIKYLAINEEDKAYNYLKKINKDVVKKYHYIEYYLLLGFTTLYLYKFDEAEVYLKKVINLIDDIEYSKFNFDEKNYLKYYTFNLLHLLDNHMNRNSCIQKKEVDALKKSFDKKNVNNNLLYLFPVKI